MKTNTKTLVTASLFVALSFVGANIKIMGTIAFDSLPAFLGALIMGPWWGAAIGAVGHLLTALTSGFPLSLPVHIAVAITMAITMVVFFYSKKLLVKPIGLTWSLAAAVLVATIMNGPVSLLLMSPLLVPMMGWPGVIGMIAPLTIVGCANAVLAVIAYRFLPVSITGKKG